MGNMGKKDPTSFRLTDECKALLRELSESFGVPQTGIIEMLVRDKARDERKYLVLYRCCGSPIEMQRFLNSELESGNELVALSGEYFVFRTLEEVD